MCFGRSKIVYAALVSMLAFALLPSSLLAASMPIGIGQFGSGATTVDFDGYTLNVSPSIPGMTLSNDGQIVQQGNGWGSDDPGRNTLTMGELTITFDVPMGRVGFIFGGNTDNSVPFETRSCAVTTGSYTLTSLGGGNPGTENWLFYGFQDSDGITSITFFVEETSAWVYGVMDLIYEERSAIVPTQPASWGSFKARYE